VSVRQAGVEVVTVAHAALLARYVLRTLASLIIGRYRYNRHDDDCHYYCSDDKPYQHPDSLCVSSRLRYPGPGLLGRAA
jgi:hypothetical protein